MLELFLCSMLTILPDYLFRRYVQGRRLGHEITLFTVWYELRRGITLCLVLTLSLITTIFYFFRSSTKAAVSVRRTVTILPETSGRVAETFVGLAQRVEEGQPLFRLDSTLPEASDEASRRKAAEIEAAMITTRSKLAEAEARIAQARGGLQQTLDELARRAEIQRRSPGSIAEADVERVRVQVETAQAALDAATASRDAIVSEPASREPPRPTSESPPASRAPCRMAAARVRVATALRVCPYERVRSFTESQEKGRSQTVLPIPRRGSAPWPLPRWCSPVVAHLRRALPCWAVAPA